MPGKAIFKQFILFNKSAFDNSFNALVMLQEQTEKAAKAMLDQAKWLPSEGQKTIDEWVSSHTKARNEFKQTVDSSFLKVEEYLAKLE